MNITTKEGLQERWKYALWALIGCALLIRLWGVWYGLPFTYYNDEYHEVMRALQLGTGSFNFNRNGKGGLYLVLFIEYGFYFVILKLAGVVGTAQEFGKLFDMGFQIFTEIKDLISHLKLLISEYLHLLMELQFMKFSHRDTSIDQRLDD